MTDREVYDQMVALFLSEYPAYLQQEGEEKPHLKWDFPTVQAFLRWGRGLNNDHIPPSHLSQAFAYIAKTTQEEAERLYMAHDREMPQEDFPIY